MALRVSSSSSGVLPGGCPAHRSLPFGFSACTKRRYRLLGLRSFNFAWAGIYGTLPGIRLGPTWYTFLPWWLPGTGYFTNASHVAPRADAYVVTLERCRGEHILTVHSSLCSPLSHLHLIRFRQFRWPLQVRRVEFSLELLAFALLGLLFKCLRRHGIVSIHPREDWLRPNCVIPAVLGD